MLYGKKYSAMVMQSIQIPAMKSKKVAPLNLPRLKTTKIILVKLKKTSGISNRFNNVEISNGMMDRIAFIEVKFKILEARKNDFRIKYYIGC